MVGCYFVLTKLVCVFFHNLADPLVVARLIRLKDGSRKVQNTDL